MNNLWRVTLLGSLEARCGEKAFTRFKSQKVASLFSYLAFHLRHAHSREILIEMLWPESDALTLRNSLSVALSSLRNQFEPPGVPQGTVIRADRFSVGLNPSTVTTDVAEFETAIKASAKAGSTLERAQYLSKAVELYQGPLLPGFYEDWISVEQERLNGLFFDSVLALVNHLEEIGDTHSALTHARHAASIDPLREESQEILIRLLDADGQSGAALRHYKESQRLLAEEVGGEPSPRLRSLVSQIESRSGTAAPDSGEPPRKRARKSAGSPLLSRRPATITFLMTDIEGSKRLFQTAPEEYLAARERHHLLIRQEVLRQGGQEVQETGDGFVMAFTTASSALSCAVAAQQALASETWPDGVASIRVRMVLHSGDVSQSGEEGRYHGIALQQATRMLTAAHGGQIIASDSTTSLASGRNEGGIRLVDLGVWRLRDIPEARRLFQVEYPGMPQTDFGPLAADSGHRPNVPPRFTRFFGRLEEIAQLREMLRSYSVRLVTITGPAGNGKSRLSVEVAEQLADSFAGAVYFVPLADLRDPAHIAGAILDSLDVVRSPQKEPLEQAVEALSEKPTLLVLDNLEHLLEGGTDVVRTLLSGVPELKVLTTSRQLLGLSAERGFSLPPLPVPGTEETPEELSLYDSVQLFIDRAQQVIPYFQVNNANAAAVAALVGGLEGIPLAIELAAARVQVLTPTQMLAQLSHRFDFLATRKRDVSERQRTLRGAVEWSYRLLPPELQRFFSRLSVFRGGWSIEAAAQVCEEPLALDYLEQLRECSLVLSSETEAGAFRFRMLETLRQYGQERLAALREGEAINDRHLSYYLKLTKPNREILHGKEQKRFLETLDSENDNLRAALAWSSSGGADAISCMLLAGALARFWRIRGYFREGREWCAGALRLGEIAHKQSNASGELADQTIEFDRARGHTFHGAGILAFEQGEFAEARELHEQALTVWRNLGDREGVATSLNFLGAASRMQGDFVQAYALFDESLIIAREVGDREIQALVLNNLGLAADVQGDYAQAQVYHEENLQIRRELGDRENACGTLNNLGILALEQGQSSRARTLFEESLAFMREIGNRPWQSSVLTNLGMTAIEQGELGEARVFLEEGLALDLETGSRISQSVNLNNLGLIAKAQGEYARARTLFEQSLAIKRDLAEKPGIGICLLHLGCLALDQADYGHARFLLVDCLRLLREVGDRLVGVGALESVARLSLAQQDSQSAARLFGAAEALREHLGAPIPPIEREKLTQAAVSLREAMDEESYTAAWTQGRAMSWEEAVEYALE